MDDENRNADTSWKEIVFAKSNDPWSTSTPTKETNWVNTPIEINSDDERFPLIQVKVEYGSETDEKGTSALDPLSLLGTRQPKKLRRRVTREDKSRRITSEKSAMYRTRRLASESAEQRATRLKRMAEYSARRLSQESPEQRALRLSRMAAYAARRLAEETPEQRKIRLTKMSAYAAKRHAMKKLLKSGMICSTDNK